jgi:hypothetical protein
MGPKWRETDKRRILREMKQRGWGVHFRTKGSMTKHAYIVGGEEVGGAYIQASMLGGVHHVPKILVMDQSNAPLERNINN